MNTATSLISTHAARRTLLLATMTVALAGIAVPAVAHEGEDHGAESPSAISIPITPRAYAQTEDFELVAQLQGNKLQIHLDYFASNAPVVDAQIEVESGANWKAQAQQIAPGVYAVQADTLAAPGRHALSFSVQAGDTADLLATSLEVAAPAQAPAASSRWGIWTTASIGAGLVLVAALTLGLARRRRVP